MPKTAVKGRIRSAMTLTPSRWANLEHLIQLMIIKLKPNFNGWLPNNPSSLGALDTSKWLRSLPAGREFSVRDFSTENGKSGAERAIPESIHKSLNIDLKEPLSIKSFDRLYTLVFKAIITMSKHLD